MMKFTLILIFILNPFGAAASGLTKSQKEQFLKRKFTALVVELLEKRNRYLAQEILQAERSLEECKEVYFGEPSLPSFSECLRHLRIHKKLIGKNLPYMELEGELNTVCESMVLEVSDEALFSFIDHLRALKSGDLEGCNDAIWKRVFLALHARKFTNPFWGVRLVRKADSQLGKLSAWRQKALDLMRSSSRVRPIN
ncbi:MAG: hypothetical protein IT289_04435 [Oligoflexia bacterium]|nr:hypothetical protein [Oligoflexia bacterium]